MATSSEQDHKGEFLLELIEKRNYWLSKVKEGSTYNAEVKEYAEAYERLICSVTTPQKPKAQ